ncbi:hypothetical protein NHE_0097 [Neorickettsia helminthoeca str. Oregon]|uniref:Uncharacterized protein n=1 Tax=Neorickettsia helminthoeca str. Oregon TaxID=1286528 RepID=X5GVK2_9RICK|nr:hypothetical protein [Neorickettsia helminthoeca]AHX11067.1 hypothetical protein NHE_0097 [Neorickettsia helminthoeca str. Oregon]
MPGSNTTAIILAVVVLAVAIAALLFWYCCHARRAPSSRLAAPQVCAYGALGLSAVTSDLLYEGCEPSRQNPWAGGKIIAVEMHDHESWIAGALESPGNRALRQRLGVRDHPISDIEIGLMAAFSFGRFHPRISPNAPSASALHVRMCFPSIKEYCDWNGNIDKAGLYAAMKLSFCALFSSLRSTCWSVSGSLLLLPVGELPDSAEGKQAYAEVYAEAFLAALARVSNGYRASFTQFLDIAGIRICCGDPTAHEVIHGALNRAVYEWIQLERVDCHAR